MTAGDFLFYNGTYEKAGSLLISPDNRSFRYGDGCFETIKVKEGKIRLAAYHFERLFSSLQLLKFDVPRHFTVAYLEEHILSLVKKNKHEKLARVRLTVYRGDGGPYDAANHLPNCLIQSWSLSAAADGFNENGLVLDIYKDARKTCDLFSALKTNNYLPYLMAALWAKENRLNDAIILNAYDRVADATIANVFIVKNGSITTPALTEGAINGIMRRHLLHSLRLSGMPVTEGNISGDDLLQASEVWLTNAIFGLKWVQQLGNSRYTGALARHVYGQFISSF